MRLATPALALLTLSRVVSAQESEDVDWLAHLSTREWMTGDWGGRRELLEEAGVSLALYYTLDVLSNVSGGRETATEAVGNVDVFLTADMGTLAGWEGGTAFLYGLANHGSGISEAVGDLQGVSNIEGPETVKLYEAWYEQELSGGRLSVLAGLYDVNSELDVIPSAGLFLNGAQGMGSELGNSGRNGPSTFPFTGLGTRLQWLATERLYVRAVVADGVPGDPSDPEGTQITLTGDDGLLLAGEFGYYNLPAQELRGRIRLLEDTLAAEEEQYGHFGKYALGVWGYTSEFEDFFRLDPGGDPRTFTGTWGVYALAEQGLHYEDEDPFQGLSAFARVGFADERANLFDRYVGGGLVYRGPFPGRGRDRLGLAVAAARLGDDYGRGVELAGGTAEGWEVAVELTYRAAITPWLWIQPDVQLVVNPGGDSDLDDALVVGARLVGSL